MADPPPASTKPRLASHPAHARCAKAGHTAPASNTVETIAALRRHRSAPAPTGIIAVSATANIDSNPPKCPYNGVAKQWTTTAVAATARLLNRECAADRDLVRPQLMSAIPARAQGASRVRKSDTTQPVSSTPPRASP